MSQIYDVRPSAYLDVTDPYTAYCFDEACLFIYSKMKDGEEPVFRTEGKGEITKPHFNSLSDMYKHYDYKNKPKGA